MLIPINYGFIDEYHNTYDGSLLNSGVDYEVRGLVSLFMINHRLIEPWSDVISGVTLLTVTHRPYMIDTKPISQVIR